MAYAISTRSTGFNFGAFLSNTAATVKAFFARRAIYAQTLAELNALSDRDLSDLGIARFQIADLAREAAYGK